MSDQVSELIDAIDVAVATILRLAELAPILDDGGPQYFPNAIELLGLIGQQANHVDKLSGQLARCVLSGPHAVEGRP
jgi:hypothetical protein